VSGGTACGAFNAAALSTQGCTANLAVP